MPLKKTTKKPVAKKPAAKTAGKILIVEDELSLLEILGDKLKREGFTVYKSTDGEDGLKKAITTKPDLILLDILMPKIDGVTMIKKLREKKGGENVPIIIISNLSEIENIAKILGAKRGVVEYLVKSHWSLEDIIKKVKQTLTVYHMLK